MPIGEANDLLFLYHSKIVSIKLTTNLEENKTKIEKYKTKIEKYKNYRSSQGFTLLHLAINQEKSQEMIAALVHAFTPEELLAVDDSGRSPLFLAIEQGNEEYVAAILKKCDERHLLQIEPSKGYTPLIYALEKNEKIAKLIASHQHCTWAVLNKPDFLDKDAIKHNFQFSFIPDMKKDAMFKLENNPNPINPQLDKWLKLLSPKVDWLRKNHQVDAARSLQKLIYKLRDINYDYHNSSCYKVENFKEACHLEIDAFCRQKKIIQEINQYRGYSIQQLLINFINFFTEPFVSKKMPSPLFFKTKTAQTIDEINDWANSDRSKPPST